MYFPTLTFSTQTTFTATKNYNLLSRSYAVLGLIQMEDLTFCAAEPVGVEPRKFEQNG